MSFDKVVRLQTAKFQIKSDPSPVYTSRAPAPDPESSTLISVNRRKADALNKGKAPRHKPPQHKHKGEVISERRSKLKQERNEEEKVEARPQVVMGSHCAAFTTRPFNSGLMQSS